MDNLDDSENNAKVSDSAYSNSCSNSQSRRSHSSKSTHSGSNSSGSSGYGGNPTSTYSNVRHGVEGGRLKDKEMKKKPPIKSPKDELLCSEPVAERMLGCDPPEDRKEFKALQEEKNNVALAPLATVSQAGQAVHSMEICNIEEKPDDGSSKALLMAMNLQQQHNNNLDSFSFVISIYDAVVMYTSSSITALLGYPKDMWVGRSFLEFIHSRDRNIFASQITNGLAMPKTGLKATAQVSTCTTMVCRVKRYKGLSNGFDVKDRNSSYIPILLKLSFKRMNEDESDCIYLVIQATPFNSAFKKPSEILTKPIPFVIRHAANGNVEYVDLESVPYLGYLPQDLVNKNALEMYHPADLEYLQKVYEDIVREGAVPRCSIYRMKTQNGDYVKVETEWTSFINPWSKKLEFVISKHYIVEGPTNPDVFQTPESDKLKLSESDKVNRKSVMDNIVRTMNDVLTKAAEIAKCQKVKRCQELADFMETQMEPSSASEEGNKQEIDNAHGDTTSQVISQESIGFAPFQADEWKENAFEGHFDITPEEKQPTPTHTTQEQTSVVMLGGISPHDEFNDSKSSSESPLSYNQLNYNENLQRYFDSHKPYQNEQVNTSFDGVYYGLKDMKGFTGQSPSPTPDEQADASTSTPMDTDYKPIRLTETLLNRHNAVMEKELVKTHRENRTDTRLERNKRAIENRRKKKEHLARCKATFRPTPPSAAVFNPDLYTIQHGVKRSMTMETDTVPRKQRCTHDCPAGSGATLPPSAGQTAILPVYYTPATSTSMVTDTVESSNSWSPHLQPMQCMMYSQTLYGSSFMYPPVPPHVPPQAPQQAPQPQSVNYTPATLNTLGLSDANYEVCKFNNLPSSPSVAQDWRDVKRSESTVKEDCSDGESPAETWNMSTDATGDPYIQCESAKRNDSAGEEKEKTDGESSYSSFYSSFFKTESGSAEESDVKNVESKGHGDEFMYSEADGLYTAMRQTKNMPKRKVDPPWMEQVCVSSELIYKYQIVNRSREEVLAGDKIRMKNMEQPMMVNEQLGQLYLELQFEGAAARLTLEEGITSSASSGEETPCSQEYREKITSNRRRTVTEYSKMTMIYEEDAPFPPPEDMATSYTSMFTVIP